MFQKKVSPIVDVGGQKNFPNVMVHINVIIERAVIMLGH